MADRTIEMHWVCSSCTTRNLGRHKVCQNCGDPKDASEAWLMPGDTRAAPSVTDPQLLRQAGAGADWQCAYCGSHQKRLDGRCHQCGAEQAQGKSVARPRPAPRVEPARSRSIAWGCWIPVAVLGIGTLASIGGLVLLIALRPPPTPGGKPTAIPATVASAHWEREVDVERYQIVAEEGFAENRPTDAMDVRSLGQRHHHDEQVLDHYDTESYEEQVPYQDTETYTEQEQCGQDCTTTAQTCTEDCSSNENGFASCHEVCTGGGQTCSPRYCSVTHTRPVTRYRSEPRTRQVPRYRSEPRNAEAFAWRAWRWRRDRAVTSQGSAGEAPHWPSDAELAPAAPLGEGEQERSTRLERYRIDLLLRDGSAREYDSNVITEYDRVRAVPRWYLGDDGRPLKPVISGR